MLRHLFVADVNTSQPVCHDDTRGRGDQPVVKARNEICPESCIRNSIKSEKKNTWICKSWVVGKTIQQNFPKFSGEQWWFTIPWDKKIRNKKSPTKPSHIAKPVRGVEKAWKARREGHEGCQNPCWSTFSRRVNMGLPLCYNMLVSGDDTFYQNPNKITIHGIFRKSGGFI